MKTEISGILLLPFLLHKALSNLGAEEVVVLEYFKDVHIANLTEAERTCNMRGGTLASEIFMDDWDIYFADQIPHEDIMNTYFAVHISRQLNGRWRHADGELVDMTSTKALTLSELDSSPENFDCALWNPWEPYYIPARCDEDNAFICKIPVTQETVCEMKENVDTMFTGVWPGEIQNIYNVPKKACIIACSEPANLTNGEIPCWAVEYRNSQRHCVLLRSSQKPTLIPDTTAASGRSTFLKACTTLTAFPESTCSTLCKCNTDMSNVVIPRTEKEMEAFKEKVTQKLKKELTVPTTNLSSTVRKKSSAEDERSSSQGFGALGIALLSLTFGFLILLDFVSVWEWIRRISFRTEPQEHDV